MSSYSNAEELKKAADSPLRHHHLRTANLPRRGDLYSGAFRSLFNQDMTDVALPS